MMRIYNYQEFDFDEDKVGDVIARCIGIRGNFKGIAETRVHDEQIKWLSFRKITQVDYTVHGKKHTAYTETSVSEEDYKNMQIAHPEMYKEPYIEHTIVVALNNAYGHYKRACNKDSKRKSLRKR